MIEIMKIGRSALVPAHLGDPSEYRSFPNSNATYRVLNATYRVLSASRQSNPEWISFGEVAQATQQLRQQRKTVLTYVVSLAGGHQIKYTQAELDAFWELTALHSGYATSVPEGPSLLQALAYLCDLQSKIRLMAELLSRIARSLKSHSFDIICSFSEFFVGHSFHPPAQSLDVSPANSNV